MDSNYNQAHLINTSDNHWQAYLRSVSTDSSGFLHNNLHRHHHDVYNCNSQYYGSGEGTSYNVDDYCATTTTTTSSIQLIPTELEMNGRMKCRNDILEETAFHRCVHLHDGIADTARNIVYLLRDRAVHGSRKVTLQQKRSFDYDHSTITMIHSKNGMMLLKNPPGSPKLDGDRSPSTVLESPVSTTHMPEDDVMVAATLSFDGPTPQQQQQQQHDTATSQGIDENNDNNINNGLDLTLPGSPPAITNSTVTTSTSGMNDNNNTQQQQQPNATTSRTNKNSSGMNSYRRVTYPCRIGNEIRTFGEYCLATKYNSSFLNHLGGNDAMDENGNRPVSSNAVSTISIAFSHDGSTMASTHGDHTVKITCCTTGRQLQSLDGHPRTPWTVKYHPINGNIVASGCLGHQVRIWNWYTKTCLQMVRLEFAIISLSFHPSGKLLAIANGTRLHFWGVQSDDDESPRSTAEITTTSTSAARQLQGRNTTSNAASFPLHQQQTSTAQSSGTNRNGSTVNRGSATPVLNELDQKHMLRCVHFPPGGKTLIIGGVNPATAEDPRQRMGGRNRAGAIGGASGMSFYLRMWDFDLDKALEVQHSHPNNPQQQQQQQQHASFLTSNNTIRNPIGAGGDQNTNNNIVPATAVGSPYNLNSIAMSMARRAISNPRTFVPRALLYNDGGFDVSPDGKTLCACAEIWLPDGINNASELLHKEEIAYDEEIRRKEEEQSQKSCDEHDTVADQAADNEVQKNNLTNLPSSNNPVAPSNPLSLAASSEAHHAAVSAALENLQGGGASSASATSTRYVRHGNRTTNVGSHGRSISYRESLEHPLAPGTPAGAGTISSNIAPRTPAATSPEPSSSFLPLTPPISVDNRLWILSPPPPPGSQSVYGRLASRRQTVSTMGMEPLPPPAPGTLSFYRGMTAPPPPPPPPPPAPGVTIRPPHPLSYISTPALTSPPSATPSASYEGNQGTDLSQAFRNGRYVPHVITISLDTDPFPENLDIQMGRGKAYGAVAKGYRPRLGQLLEACPLDATKAAAVTCVKFSPSTDFCLIGYGVREPASDANTNNASGNNSTNNTNFHPVTAVYRIRGGMTHVSTMLSGDDDVNIARFHPDSGHSFVYGTKQGRVRVLSKRPWNFYDS